MQICANAVFITPSKPQNFSSKQILSKERWDRVGQLVETTHPNEHTLFCSVSCISFKCLLAYANTAQDTGLCYLAFCPAACLWSPRAALLALATVFVLTLPWQCLVIGSAIYMDCRIWLLPWPCSWNGSLAPYAEPLQLLRSKIQRVKTLLKMEQAAFDSKFFNTIPKFLFISKKIFNLLDLGRIPGDNQQLQADHNY